MELLIIIGLLVIALIIVLIIRTLKLKEQIIEPFNTEKLKLDKEKCLKNLSTAIQIETISHEDSKKNNYHTFKILKDYIETEFNDLLIKSEKIDTDAEALVYRYKGTSNQKPILLTAHLDVVPINKEQIDNWIEPPFSGKIKDGYIWGRGTLDIKSQAMAILEALRYLCNRGFRPKRDIYFAFGMDEEVGGKRGAKKVSEYFKKNNIEFSFVLDEGGAVTENSLKGIKRPIAVVGVCEKGHINMELIAKSKGGHAAMPSKTDPLVRLMKAGVLLNNKPFDKKLIKPVEEMLKRLAPHMSLPEKIIISNLFIFKKLFMHIFEKTPTGNAMLRTTSAYTVISGSSQENILPQEAMLNVNMRVLHGDTSESVYKEVSDKLENLDIEIRLKRKDNPSNISQTSNNEFKFIERCIRTHFKDSIITPYLMMASSDALHYEKNSECVYRFSPYQIDNSDLKKMHGNDECISVENYLRMIEFYITIAQNIN